MNIWIKYGPIFYSLFRNNYWWSKIWLLIAWCMNNIVLPFLILFILYFFNYISINELINTFLVFLGCFIVFTIRYEIWYLYNDIVSVTKEKNPTIRINEILPNNYLFFSCIIRILLWLLWNFLIYYLNENLWTLLLWLEIVMLIFYAIHNMFRNLYINFFTIFLLRLTKYLVFIIVIFVLLINIFEAVLQPLILFIAIFQLIEITYAYNIKFWWKNKVDILLVYTYIALTQIIFYLLFKDISYLWIFLHMLITILYVWLSKIKILKKLFM